MHGEALQEMAIAIFPHVPWSRFPYARALAALRNRRAVYYVTEDTRTEGYPDWLAPLNPEEARARLKRPELAVVTHPYWIGDAAALRAERLLVLLPEGIPEEGEARWRDRLRQCAALADLFAAESEALYLEQSLKKEAALLLRDSRELAGIGEDRSNQATDPPPDWETFLERAIASLLAGESAPIKAVTEQRQLLAHGYEDLRQRIGPHETVSFLLAVYDYLLMRPEAPSLLLEAFLHAVRLGRADSLQTHYRFLSAILARQGSFPEALDAYGVSALAEEDRLRYEELCRLAEAGLATLAQAQLLRYNDDWNGALALLAEDASPAAAAIRLRILLDAGRWEEALSILTPERLIQPGDRRDYLVLRGRVGVLRGDRHGGIGDLLAAVEMDRDALAYIQEIRAGDEALSRLRSRLRTESEGRGSSRSTTEGGTTGGSSAEGAEEIREQADCHDAGSQ